MSNNEGHASRFEIRLEVIEDEMHRHVSTSVKDRRPMSRDDWERSYRHLKNAKAGVDLQSEAPEQKAYVRDPIEQMLDEILAAERAKPAKQSATGGSQTIDQSEPVGIRQFSKIADGIRTYLALKGFPDPFQLCLTHGEQWEALPADWDQMSTGERTSAAKAMSIELGWAFVRRISPPLTDEWFAAEIAMRLFELENTQGPRREILVFQIAELKSQMQSRRHLPNVRRERRADKNREKGREQNRNRNAPVRNQIISEMKTLISPRISVRAAAVIVFNRGFGTSAESNRGFYNRAKK